MYHRNKMIPMTIGQTAFTHLDRFVEQRIRADHTPGIVLAVTDREKTLRAATYGSSNVDRKAAITPFTLFEIGSISKSFTALALLQLQEAGEIDLHQPVERYLPWFHVPSAYDPITLHHLLSHTGGIISGTDFTTQASYEVWALRETEATAPPGTWFHYSNVGYKVLGLVLERVLRRGYGRIIQERVLHPLRMHNTVPVITHEIRSKMAVGYEPLYDDRPPHPALPLAPATWLETNTADGSIASTAGDMTSYVRMLLNRGRGPDGPIVSKQSYDRMTQRVIRPDEDHGEFYGYGLTIDEREGRTVVGHEGGMVGYYAAVQADLDAGVGAVVLTNGPGEPKEIARFALEVTRAALSDQNLPPLPPTPDPKRVEHPEEYTGIYRSAGRVFGLAAEDGELVMSYRDDRIALERRGRDTFYVPHVDFSRFLLRFGRQEGKIVEALHGPDWYPHPLYTGARDFVHPPAWTAYTGHYRAHNAWLTNFRVVLRKGELLLIEPQGDEEPLQPLEDGHFRVGADPRSPERIRFDTLIDGRTARATLSGCPYYRTFTP